MPPSPRKRLKRSPTPSYESDSEFEFDLGLDPENDIVTSSPTLPGILQATKGFLSLPPELISQILSYFEHIRIEHIMASTQYLGNWKNTGFGESSASEELSVRFDVLRALSQLSRLSRIIFLPLYWERFQLCLVPKSAGSWYHYLADSTERKCQGMLESPHLWRYIKIVTVSMTRHKSFKVIPQFVQLLGVFPHVHTLEVVSGGYMMIQSLKKYFEGNSFSSIQKVVLPTSAHDVLRCCPKLREVTCTVGEGGQIIASLVQAGCPKLEVLRGVSARSVIKKRLNKANPPLKCVRMNGRFKENLTETAMLAFSAFPSLQVIEIEASESDKLDDTVELARTTLRKCAEPVKVTRSWNLRESTRNTRLAKPGSENHGSRTVRILRYKPTSIYLRAPANYVPVKIEGYSTEA